MPKIIRTPTRKIDKYGRVLVSTKQPADFYYLIGMNYKDIVLFDDGNDTMLEQGIIILPRYYYLFIGKKDQELMYKPYEFDQYRVVITTYKDIITSIDAIG